MVSDANTSAPCTSNCLYSIVLSRLVLVSLYTARESSSGMDFAFPGTTHASVVPSWLGFVFLPEGQSGEQHAKL